MRYRTLRWFALPAVLALGACGDRSTVGTGTERSRPLATTPAAQGTTPAGATLANYWANQKLIRTAELSIQVADVQAAMRAADTVASRRGALVADSRVSRDEDGEREAHVVIRVPSERFVETLAALRTIGDVKIEAVKTQDVTKEYADLETRLTVKEQTVTRLRALMSDRTAKLSDVLAVETDLARTITELEQLKGERRYYDQQVAISTISVTFAESISGTRLAQLTDPISDAFRSSLEVLGRSLSAVIYLVVFLLPWATVVLIAWWVGTRLRSRFFTGPAASDTPP